MPRISLVFEKWDTMPTLTAIKTTKMDYVLRAIPTFRRLRKMGRPLGLTFHSLLHEVHVTVPLQEFKITHPVKIILGAQFHFRVLDDLG